MDMGYIVIGTDVGSVGDRTDSAVMGRLSD